MYNVLVDINRLYILIVVLAVIFESVGARYGYDSQGHCQLRMFPRTTVHECTVRCGYFCLWLFLTNKWEMSVSTTHSCVGGRIALEVPIVSIDMSIHQGL